MDTNRIWTPYYLPPAAEDISELSPSAIKVIQYIERQENIKFRRMENINFCHAAAVHDIHEKIIISSSSSKNNDFSFCEILDKPIYTSEEIETYSIPNIIANSNQANESLDMFEESMVIDYKSEKNQNFKIKRKIDQEKQILTEKIKQKPIIQNKISNYFASTKNHSRSNSLSKVDQKPIIKRVNCPVYKKESLSPKALVNNTIDCRTVNEHFDKIPELSMKTKPSITKLSKASRKEAGQINNSNYGLTEFANKNENILFPNPPPEALRTVQNLRPPFREEIFSNGFSDVYNFSPADEMKIEDSLIEACSYDSKKFHSISVKNFPEVATGDNAPIQIIDLSINNRADVLEYFTSDSLIEIGLTLCYREGICLLNRSSRTNCTPNGLLLCSKFVDGSSQMIFFSHEQFKEISLRNVLLHILHSLTRKICYDAQAVILYILDNIKPEDKRVCYDWCILDPLVGAWLLDPDHPPSSYDDFLKEYPYVKIPQNVDWKTECSYLLICQSHIMENLYAKLMKENLWNLFLYLEVQIIPILAVMEASEILIDTEKLKKMSQILQEKLLSLEKKAETLVGHELSLNSMTHVRKVLYDELKLDKAVNIRIKGTAIKGVKSTSESMLKLLIKVHPLPSVILEYRQLFKLKSTYTDKLFEFAKEGGFVSSMWDLCSAATGRITSSNPNLQAIPKQSIYVKSQCEGDFEINLRSCFLARKCNVLISADFQHIELRVFTILAQDTDLIRLLRKSDDIFHSMTQLRLNKDEITPEERNQTKTLVYALMYGAGVKKIAGILSLSENEAEKLKKSFLSLFPALSDFTKKILTEVRLTKVLQSLSGRKRFFPNIHSSNVEVRKYSERQAINFVIQGSATDICKGAMLRAELELKKQQLNTKLLLQIHDELLWEVQEEDIHTFKGIIEDAIDANKAYWAKKVRIDIALPVAIKIGKEWGNMK